MIKQLSTKIVYQNKWMTVKEDGVEFANGSQGIFGTVEKPDFALIVPLFENGFQLVKQYRYPVQQSFWEFPQGSYEEKPGIDPAELAKNELKEETGLVAGVLKKVGFLYEAYGYCNQGFHIFLAQDLLQLTAKREQSEQDMVSKRVTFAEFEQMVERGEITDAPTMSAYGLLRMKRVIV